MVSNKLLLVLGALLLALVVGAGSWVMYSTGKSPTSNKVYSSTSSNTEINDVEIRERLEGLEWEVAKLKLEIGSLHRISKESGPTERQSETPQELGATSLGKNRSHEEPSYELRMSTERIDSKWAPNMEDTIRQAFNKEEFKGSNIRRLECRSTVCKITVDHTTEEDQRVFSDLFPIELPGSGGRVKPFGNAEEGWGSTLYLDREVEETVPSTPSGPPMKIPSIFQTTPQD